ncbi:hypothetical protein JCM19302_4191 [Jejuia pallidilutea]|uniref:Succinylglutamate desuccinylase/Aspartoacylase catalytic domain-containing protein n=1 Tax=Jejuia pallidilutea TaxID=504487 RepID=A0A090WPX3_9FLAO|nr:succinylglutamate desuccinylase/aspartoacylase family protein [Jejuia pallidilutea]GAL69462.1 hypothetical protein JCM19302_4191 [Jejuia pallidilutea]
MNTLQTKAPFTNKDTRILFKIHKNIDLPTVVFFGGIHGNEKAGVTALKQLQSTIDSAVVKGNVYGVLGNLKAWRKTKGILMKI